MSVLLMIIASACFATMAALIKAIGPSLPIPEIIFFRSIIPLPFFIAILLLQKKKLIVSARRTLLLRALFGFLAMSGFYYALTHLPLAESVFLGRTQPLILAVLAPWIVNEKPTGPVWFAIGTGLFGIILIIQPSFGWLPAAWASIGAASASALAHLLVRKLNRTDDPQTIVTNFFMVSAILSGAWTSPQFVLPEGRLWLLLGGVALFSTFGQYLMTMAYRLDHAPVVAAASYSSIIFSIVYGFLFWQEIPPAPAWFGGALIIAGSFILIRSRV
ncbi:DMT family transporter [Prosthecochloris sp. N3]|uniref:DMT family transporter n=1 Tax=Prosthecochloris ethylica TaxID=2743976 RepID=A0ABR9XR85_9CHLB|nr:MULTISPECIES: DMT family transporter [Prosthecochloris]MBF0586375.1 DMT family transporter [Prosthecochloris ethylica]MBF0636407.1 DMT family transporter [Prosthecochloris ethylica]NUK47581.1 DMT family transporter [Prosthecochloris ethylica]RNA64171.1 DMT family transporter [Prosthecochloris sp. ZM_2]